MKRRGQTRAKGENHKKCEGRFGRRRRKKIGSHTEEKEEDRRRRRETEKRRGDRRFRLEFLPFFLFTLLAVSDLIQLMIID